MKPAPREQSIGCDPGSRTGALVWLSEQGEPLLTVSWVATLHRPVRRDPWTDWDVRWRTLLDLGEGRRTDWTGADWPAVLARIDSLLWEPYGPLPPRCAVEGLIPHERAARETLLDLGTAAGQMMGILLRRVRKPIQRPLSSLWRKEMLGILENSRKSVQPEPGERLAAACERRAIERAQALVPGLGLEALPPKHRGHVAEAYWMARWAQVQVLPC